MLKKPTCHFFTNLPGMRWLAVAPVEACPGRDWRPSAMRQLATGLFAFLALLPALVAKAQNVITTIAGGGPNNVPAVSANVAAPSSVATDNLGNIFIAAQGANRVFKVDASGLLTVVAGNGTLGFSGDGGLATSASLNGPQGVAVDGAGNLFIADTGNNRIRRADAQTGVITTVAGNGTLGFSGDGGLATSASLNGPQGVAVDGAGNLFIADTGNNLIRRVDAQTAIITTVVGNGTAGFSGDGGPATSASLNGPHGVAVDGAGNLFIADTGNNLIRRVDAETAIITTVVGNGTAGFSGDGGPAIGASLAEPFGVALDSSGNLFIADFSNNRIRRVDATSGIITTEAGNGTLGFSGDGGPATSASLSFLRAVALDGSGNLFIADFSNNRIRRVDATSGIITTVAGNGTSGFSGDGGPAIGASLAEPFGVALDGAGNLFIADTGNNLIRRVDATSGIITTVAGNGLADFSGDGGPATSASLNSPTGVALDASGNLFIADEINDRIRRVDASTGAITTVAGNGTLGFSGDGGPATSASLYSPYGVAVDTSGNFYIADTQNNRIRRVDGETGIITTVVGNGTAGFSGDGGPATGASLDLPFAVAFDSLGNLLIADEASNRIRRVDATSGIITTVAGNGTFGFSGDSGPATSASLAEPFGVALDNSGNLFIADAANDRIRRVTAGPTITLSSLSLSFGNQVVGTTSAGQPVTLTNTGSVLLTITSITITGTNSSDFAETENCGPSLAAGAACTITVTFTPTNSGAKTGAVTILSNAGLGSPVVIQLSGTGAVPVLSLSSTALTFAGLIVGMTSATQTVTLSNTGNATLLITGITITGTNSADFAQTNTCGAPLATGGSCTLSITFTPTAPGVRSGLVSVTDNALDSPQLIYVNGTGFSAAVVGVSVPTIDFGNQVVGTVSAPQTVILSNIGTGPLGIESITTTADFDQTSDCPVAPATLAVGLSCVISVTFTPTTAVKSLGSLTITDDAAGSPHIVTLSGTGLAAVVSPSVTILSFGNQLVGSTSAPQPVTLTNTGNLTLNITSIIASGDYAETNNCGASLAVAAPCTLNVTFRPGSPGLRSGSLTIADDALGSPQIITLTGTGTILPAANPYVAYTPQTDFATGTNPRSVTSADFNGDGKSDLAVANSNDNTVSILLGNGDGTFQTQVPYATGMNPQSVTAGDLNGDGRLDLAVANRASNTVSILLGSGDGTFQAKSDFSVSSTPVSVATGDFNGDGKPDLAVANFGGGTLAVLLDTAAAVSISSLTFGDQVVGATSAPQTVTLTNADTTALINITSIKPGGDFSETDTCPGSLAPATSCTISVTLTPSTTGPATAILTITDDAVGSPHKVNLTGNGVILMVSITPPSLSFANQVVGTSSAAQSVTLLNTGTTGLKITSIVANGDFVAQGSACGATLAAGGSCTISVTFAPTAAGTRTGVVTITDNAPGSPQVVNLTGAAIQPLLTVSPNSLDFGSQLVGTTGLPKNVTLTISGDAALTISSVASSGDFAWTSGCTSNVSPGVMCTIGVFFDPMATGSLSGTLTITDNAPGSPHTVSLTGTGIQPAVTLSSASVAFPETHVGLTCSPRTVTVANTGSAALHVTSVTVSAEFVLASDGCTGTTVVPGASCTVTAQFAPTTTGPRTGTITIIDDAPGNPHTTALSGTGLPPCALTASSTTATVVEGSNVATFEIEDTIPSGFPGPINLLCAGQEPATCIFNPTPMMPKGKSLLTLENLVALKSGHLTFTAAGESGAVPGLSGPHYAQLVLTVKIGDFAFTVPPSATVGAGSTATYQVAVLPVQGLTGLVSLSCSGAPTEATCSVSPPSVTLDGVNAAWVKVTVTTTARSRGAPGVGSKRVSPPSASPLLWPGLLGLLALGLLASRRLARARGFSVALASTLLLLLLWAACGGGGFNSAPVGTPSGTYALTLTGAYNAASGGSSSSLSHSTTLTLTVN